MHLVLLHPLSGLCFRVSYTKYPLTQLMNCSLWMSSRIFMFFQICIHYFKMNSYFKMNRDYREAWLAGGEAVSSYPANLRYKDFFMFLAHPTFTY